MNNKKQWEIDFDESFVVECAPMEFYIKERDPEKIKQFISKQITKAVEKEGKRLAESWQEEVYMQSDIARQEAIKKYKRGAITKGKVTKFPKATYDEVIKKYQQFKGIKLQGNEFLPVQQTVKSMLVSGRTKEDIISFMEFLSDTENPAYSQWTIRTIKMKMPEYLAGKLKI